jgi:hypothetical protein
VGCSFLGFHSNPFFRYLFTLQRKKKPVPISCTGLKSFSFFLKKSGDWVTAKGFPFTGLAVFAYPDGIELVHGLLNQFGIVGEDASLEVAGAIAFHADACAGEVGAADVGNLVIKNQDLEMHPWTKCPFKAIKQSRVFVEVLAKSGTWLLGVDEPYLNAFFDELSQYR